MDDDVEKLLKVGFIKEIKYIDQFANVMLVKRPQGSGEYALTLLTWMTHAQKITIMFLNLILWLIQRLDMPCSASWLLSPDTIRS